MPAPRMRKRLVCAGALAALAALAAICRADRLPGEVVGEGRIVSSIKFTGNKKAEDDAIRLNVGSAVGEKLKAERLREDVRAIWKMGYFDDVQAEAVEEGADKTALLFVLREKPSISKIFVQGNREV